jgi:hypothetical protein
MSNPKNVVSLLLTGTVMAAATPAFADSSDDRFTLHLGAMQAQGSGELAGNNILGSDLSFRKGVDLGDKEISPRLDGMFRISERNRLIFDYFSFEKDGGATLDHDVDVGGDVILPSGSFAKAQAKFELASLIYDFSVIDTPTFSGGLQLGAEWAKVSASAKADVGDTHYREGASRDGYAPVVGLRLTAKPAEKFLLSFQAQYLDAGWGNFDFDGQIKRANAIAEYRFTPNFGVYAGYDWFKVKYEEAGHDGTGSIGLDFKGPIGGVTLAF